jgi:hypothetical protein
MLKGLVTMSGTEIDRLAVIEKIHDGRLMQTEAAKLLGLSSRQVRRLEAAYLRDGAAGLVSKKRGRRSNNTIKAGVQAEAMALVAERYDDFGPTLAAEKLVELHGLEVSRETLRKWMADAGLWTCRHERVGKLHQPRKRRDCLGELIQIDGCEHAWFEDRGPPCTLLVFVDDATTRLMELRFAVSESTFDYFEATKCYLRRHGRPVALYSDKHSIFRVAHEGTSGRNGGVTQYGRALGELGIDIICANSPQAKGRVERIHQTLQDRLVKELRLRGISTIAEANAFLPGFMEDFNRRFAKPARSNHDAHRPLRESDDLEQIFTWQETRIMSRDLVVHYKRVTYLVQPNEETRRLAGNKRQVDVLERADGTVEIRHQGRSLPYLIHDQQPQIIQGEVVENKRLGAVLAAIQATHAIRDAKSLASSKRTLREKARLREARLQAGLQEVPAPPTPQQDAFAAYFAEFMTEQRHKQKVESERAKERRLDRQVAAALARQPPRTGPRAGPEPLSPANAIVEQCSKPSRLPSLRSAASPALTAPALSPGAPLCRTGQQTRSDRTFLLCRTPDISTLP